MVTIGCAVVMIDYLVVLLDYLSSQSSICEQETKKFFQGGALMDSENGVANAEMFYRSVLERSIAQERCHAASRCLVYLEVRRLGART